MSLASLEARLTQMEAVLGRIAPVGAIAPRRSYTRENPGQVIATEGTLAALRGEPGFGHSPESLLFARAVALGYVAGDEAGYETFMAWIAGSNTHLRIEQAQYVAQALADYNAEQGTWVTDVERRLLTVRQNGWEVDEATLRSAYKLVAEGPG